MQTGAATGSGGMLSKENGMATHGCLLSVVGDNGRGQTGLDEVSGMSFYRFQTFIADILAFLFPEAKAVPEFGAGKCDKTLLDSFKFIQS